MYAVMLLLGTIAACITLSPGLQDALKKVSYADNSEGSFLDYMPFKYNLFAPLLSYNILVYVEQIW